MRLGRKLTYIFVWILFSFVITACKINLDIPTVEQEQELVTITFNSNEGSLVDPISGVYNSIITAPTKPTRAGFAFDGWYSESTLSRVFTFDKMPEEDFTLYAKWSLDQGALKTNIVETMQDAVNALYDNYGETEPFYLLPSTGEVKLLVIPIQFTNDLFTSSELNTIEDGFFGNQTSYLSVKSYYQKSSYGHLNISGEVLSPYTAKNNYDYYNNCTNCTNEYATGVDVLIEEAINYYSTTQPNLDLSQYDTDQDGYLDAVHLVYSAPTNFDDSESSYWAFQYYYTATMGENYLPWGNYEFDSYVFSGIDFFYESDTMNAWTQIHETGHLFGLEDYYDYEIDGDQNKGGLGGADMMDDTRGDHNAFSKLLMDWIDPYVVTNSFTLSIRPFESTGDAVIISDEFTTIFDEYFMVSYHTPTGLNSENAYFTESGVVIYHVNAVLPADYDNLDGYSYYLEHNNSTSSNKLLSIIEADQDNSIFNASIADNDDLFQAGNSITLQLIDNTTLCTVSILNMSVEEVTIEITFHS